MRRALPTVELPCDDDGLPTKRERREPRAMPFRALLRRESVFRSASWPASTEVVRGADADSVTSDVTAPSSITATTASTASVPRVDPSAATAAIGQAATEGQNARQQLKELCEKFSADLSIAEVTDVLVPKGSFSFEFAVDGLRCGVGSARSKKEAKEQAAALALRALAREPPRDL